MPRNLDDEATRELGIDARQHLSVVPVRLLQDGARKSVAPAQTQEPPFEPALTAGVDQGIEHRPAPVHPRSVLIDHPSAESLLREQPKTQGGVDRVLDLITTELEERAVDDEAFSPHNGEAIDTLHIGSTNGSRCRSHGA